MKRNDLMTMTTVALATATLTVGSFWAVPLEAGNENEPLTPKIAKPTLAAKGVEVMLSAVSGTEKAGDEPVFELAALNTSDRPAELNVQLSMAAMSPADALSRVVRLPARLWEGGQSIVLGPNERKTYTVFTGTKLPMKNLISVTLREAVSADAMKVEADAVRRVGPLNAGQQGIAILSFSTTDATPLLAEAQPNR